MPFDDDPDVRAAYAEHLIREAIIYATEQANMRAMEVINIIASALAKQIAKEENELG